MFLPLIIFWFIRTAKAILFWIYLWQLKEYHIGRFLDHLRTEKGKKLFLNKILILKLFLFVIFLIPVFHLFNQPAPIEIKEATRAGLYIDRVINLSSWEQFNNNLWVFSLYFIYILYFLESIKALQNFIQKRAKRPVFTKKTIFLILTSLLVELLVAFALFNITSIYFILLGILLFDILTPLVVSLIVLLFQPAVVLVRNRIIKKAKEKRAQFKDLLVIGITGSYGKTSTKEFLYAILSEKFGGEVLKTKEHQNSEIGISQCVLSELNSKHKIFIVEMGAYGRGGIKLLSDIVRPKIGILTGINEQHLSTFGSLENIIKTKYELIESLPQDGTAFFNGRNAQCVGLYGKTKIRKFLYGEKAEFSGEENILGAVRVAKELGMTDEEINKAVAKIDNKFGGIQIKKGISGFEIIDATFSANPDSVIAHLDYIKSFLGQKVIIMPCLIELGSASKEVHERIGRKIAEVCDLAIITTKDRFQDIQKGARAGKDKVLFIENPKEIFEKVKSFCKEGDTVLLESRVPKKLIEQLNR